MGQLQGWVDTYGLARQLEAPVYLRFAGQLKFVFPGLDGLEDQIESQSFQWQDRPKPIIGLDVYILQNGNALEQE